jgi:HlyD family secretion protein
MSEQREIFRKESLERLSSPEQLDRLLVVVGSKGWLTLLTVGFLCAAGLAWAVFGRIPETVNGAGVLINPGNVRGIQAPATGHLVDLPLRVGQHVSKGEVIGVLEQPDIQEQLDQEEARLKELIDRNAAMAELDEKRLDLELKSIEAQKGLAVDGIKRLKELSAAVRTRTDSFNKNQRDNLLQTRTVSVDYNRSLERRLDTLRKLQKDKLVPDDVVLSAENSYNESKLQIASLDLKVHELGVKEIESEQYYLQQENRIADFEMQLKQLEVREQTARQERLQGETTRKSQEQETRRKIAQLRLSLAEHTKVVSDFSGRVLEITASRGQLLGSGTRVATLELDSPDAELKNLVYFSVKDGKRITPGMSIRVTPTTVQRERHGAILGKVTRVSSFPISQEAAANVVGSSEIARTLTQGSAVIEVEADLELDPNSPSGYKWTSKGPDLKFTAGTTSVARVTVDERAPITYVLPILGTWVFGTKDENVGP